MSHDTETSNEAGKHSNRLPDRLPILPLSDTVIFPMTIGSLYIGQDASVRLVEEAVRGTKLVGVVAQRAPEMAPTPETLHGTGTAATLLHVGRGPDGALRAIVQGIERFHIREYLQREPYLIASIGEAPQPLDEDLELEALSRSARELFQKLVSESDQFPAELGIAARATRNPKELAYLIASSAPFNTRSRQELLDALSINDVFHRLVDLLHHELAIGELQSKLATDTRESMNKEQKEYFLRQQLRTIRRELGDEDSEDADADDLQEKLAKAQLTGEAHREGQRELRRLRSTPSASPEHGIIRSYLEWLSELPWTARPDAAIDVPKARETLDSDHYDLEKVKERILEYLAVKKLRDERAVDAPPVPTEGATEARRDVRREPILCLVGPPGVGKTSLGQSVARALGRPFVRISLGGIHDEAEIRGHRRTYIGAMPGRIIQAMRRIETRSPVFMLDEVDKLGQGFHGDPGAALLEVLDPAQNHAFTDTYLGVPFDLSGVLFICTANTTETIPAPLLDRMEVLSLPGYTDREKLQIARRFLLPRVARASGLREGEVTLDDEALVRTLRDYTRESGVRSLERALAQLTRKAARGITEGAKTPVTIDAAFVRRALGPPVYFDEVAERIDRPGVAIGLAWTPVGGDVLFVEATMMPAREERLILTGMLGDVMRESVQAALSYLRSCAARFGVDPRAFRGQAVHVHVPAGAIPKDGPSAGITMLVALASLVSGRIVDHTAAVTGEITLRGKVLPVGGIKEKVLAAHRAGLRKVVLPRRNQGSLEDVPEDVKAQMEFVFIDSAEEALRELLGPRRTTALGEEPVPAGAPH